MRRATNVDPHNAKLWNKRGLALCHLRRHAEAIESFDRALEIDPEYIDAWNNKGVILYKLMRYEEAIACFNHIIDNDPKYIKYGTIKGWYWARWRDARMPSRVTTEPST